MIDATKVSTGDGRLAENTIVSASPLRRARILSVVLGLEGPFPVDAGGLGGGGETITVDGLLPPTGPEGPICLGI
jgi:hypothetical protein